MNQRNERNVCVAARLRRFPNWIYFEVRAIVVATESVSLRISNVCLLVHHSTLHFDLFYPLDVNECDENPNYCQYGGQCVNTPGSYRCLCQQGYEAGNGGTYCIGKGVCLTVCQ